MATATKIIELDQTIDELNRMRSELLSFLVDAAIDGEGISRLELSVYEVVINILDHASEDYRDEKVTIKCQVSEDSVITEIISRGEEFNINAAELPDIESHAKAGKRRGLGLYIIRTLMNKVEYRYADSTSFLTLTMNRSSR